MRGIAWVFAICTMTSAACSFDASGQPNAPDPVDAATTIDSATVTGARDAGAPAVDAQVAHPDACTGKKCGGGPGPD
jgi:hypothetical protein